MKRPVAILIWVLTTVMLAAVTSFAVLWTLRPQNDVAVDFHEWAHEHLELSPSQHQALDPAERKFSDEQAELNRRITEAERALADVIANEETGADEISSALDVLHRAQGELQHLTLAHFFEMKEQLDPEQAEKLRQWTHDRLIHP